MNHQDTKAPREPIRKETDEVAPKIVDAAFAVHRALGPGLLGSAYEVCQLHELNKRGLKAARLVLLPVVYDNLRLDAGLRPDLVVEKRVVVELKAVEALLPVHKAQLLTCLKLTCHRLGLLVNFSGALIKQGMPAIDPLIH
jgi:GxxExxY protein